MAYSAYEQSYLDRSGITDPSQIDRSSPFYLPAFDPWSQESQAAKAEQQAFYTELSGGVVQSVADIDYNAPGYMPGFDPYTEWDDRPLLEQWDEKIYEQEYEKERKRLDEETTAKNLRENVYLGSMGSGTAGGAGMASVGGSPTVSLLAPAKKK